MKIRLGLVALGFLASLSSAVAADVAVPVYKAAPPAPPAVSWTGFYVGGNVGYGWGNGKTDLGANGDNITFPTDDRILNSNVVALSTNLKTGLSGMTAGVQAGYNWSVGRILLGIEADISALNQHNNANVIAPIRSGVCTGTAGGICSQISPMVGTLSANVQTSIDWTGAVRGRIGLRPSELTLLYATGGLAYGRVRANGNIQGSTLLPDFNGFITWSGDNVFGSSAVKYGYALGGGIEGKLAAATNWSWKFEYLYVDLGSIASGNNILFRSSYIGITGIAGSVATHTRFSENMLRAGLNYTFDWGKMPVVAKY